MDFPQVQPQNLEAIFSQNPGMWGMAQDYMARANQGNDLAMQRSQLANQFEQQSQPFRLAQLGLQNDTSRAQLPGIQADSRSRVRKDANEEALNPQLLKDLQGKYTSAELSRHIDDMDKVGTMFRQYATQAENATLPGQKPSDALNAKLKAMGMEGMINPAWADLDGPTLAKTLSTVGDQIGNESTKYRSAIDMLNAKGEISKALADKNNAARQALEQQRAETRMKVQEAIAKAKTVAGAKDPKTFEAVAAAAMAHAAAMEEGPEKDQAIALANQAQQQAIVLKQAGATAVKPGTIDTAEMTGLPAPSAVAPPPIAIPPKDGSAAKPAPPKHTLSDVQKSYPGIPAEKLKELYKKKFGVDLQ